MLPYYLGYYFLKGSPRVITYAMFVFLGTLYSFIYIRRFMNLDMKTFLSKNKYPLFLLHSAFIYFAVMTYMMPYIYNILSDVAGKNSKNYFQLIILILTSIYESCFSFIFEKLSNLLPEYNNEIDYTFLIVIAKYYYTVFYSLRLGNILYLEFTDWGLYLQFISFLWFIFQHNTGISIFSYLCIKPLSNKLIKTKNALITYNNKILNIRANWFRSNKEKNKEKILSSSTFKRNSCKTSSKLNFSKNSPVNNKLTSTKVSSENSQKNAFLILCFQKLEFFFIYVPTILFLWLYKS